MVREGVRVDDCRTVYPSMTHTSHTTLVTGLYPRSHGIFSNQLFDRRCNLFRDAWMSSYNGRSLAELSKDQGRRTVSIEEFTLFTRGADIYIHVPSHRVEEVVRFAKAAIETKRPDVAFVVFFAVDDTGHIFGPQSREVDRIIKKVDDALSELISSLQTQESHKRMLSVLTSDHGAVSVESNVAEEIRHAVCQVDREMPVALWGRFAEIFPRNNTQLEAVVRAMAGARGVDVVLEREELMALNTKTGISTEVVVSLKKGYYCLEKAPIVPRGYHGGLEDEEMGVPLVFYGDAPRDIRLPFAETVDIAPTVAEHMGMSGSFEGISLLRAARQRHTREDSYESLRKIGGNYRERISLIRKLSELKRQWSDDRLTDKEFRAEVRGARRALRKLAREGAKVRESVRGTC